jgi:uncharacterized protein with PQ loop repeat
MFSIDVTWHEALSGVFGSISLAAWIFLLVPQLIENYTNGHADGISLTFLIIWFVGDICNLAGAIWAGLVPTVIALAIYFCFSDTVLILQCLYYLNRKRVADGKEEEEEASGVRVGNALMNGNGRESSTEQTPLLSNGAPAASKSPRARASHPKRRLTDVTDENLGLPGSRRPSAAAQRRNTNERPDVLGPVAEDSRGGGAWFTNAASIFVVCAVGAAGWAVAWRAGAWTPTPVGDESGGHEEVQTPVGAELLGYISAVLYLGARIPQIIKNQRERSCEGLSLLFFLLSLMGNLTYGAGVSLTGVFDVKGMTDADDSLDHVPLCRRSVHHHQSALAHRFAGNYGRRRHHFRPVPHVWLEERGHCGGINSDGESWSNLFGYHTCALLCAAASDWLSSTIRNSTPSNSKNQPGSCHRRA